MITAAKKCGCPDKSDLSTFHNFTFPPDSFKKDSEKCVCPKPNEPGYDKLRGSCDICCEGDIESIEEEVIEEKSKTFSEIVEKGLPYKELEAVINDNRLIIRVQKDNAINDEWDPPCDCIEETGKSVAQKNQHLNKDSNITFRKVDFQNPCRTVTVFPQPDSEITPPVNDDKLKEENGLKLTKEKNTVHSKAKKQNQQQNLNSIDLEENPNIFLLRIKKRCENEDGKYNIDLEFRTPRPWLPKPVVEKPPPLPPIIVVENKIEEKKKKKKKKKKKGKK